MQRAFTEDEIRGQVREYLRAGLCVDVDDGADIFRSGFVNSLFAVQLVMFVEERFGVTVDSEEMELGNFRSVDAVTGYVLRKTGDLAAR
jgi:methoxymalonate biosynthesis acyl carrier protein